MKFQSTLRTLLVAAALLLGLAWLNDQTPALFAQTGGVTLTSAAPAGGAAATPDVAMPEPSLLSVLSRLILGNIDFVTITIFALSIVSLTFIIRGFIQTRKDVVLPEATTTRIREMIAGRQYQELLDFTETDPTFVSKSINPALKRAPHFGAMKEAMETAVGEQTAEAFRRIEILNIVGNLGPLLGLLGTVLGMIEAFDAMQRTTTGAADPKVLAGGIATALAHTFLGLFLAIPTLAAFGILRTMTDRLTTRAAIESEDLLILMKPSDRPVPTPQPGQAMAAAQPGMVMPPRPQVT
jgi:biopolymer transport protein ExbB